MDSNENKDHNGTNNSNSEKKEIKRKSFVLDTNVLIHDPNALFEFDDNRVVLPMKVIEELDKFKSFKDEKGLIVRTVTRTLDKLRDIGKLKKGVLLDNGGIIQIVVNYLPEYNPDYDFYTETNEDFELMDTSIPDNEIILTALKLQRKNKEKVIFVSKDLNSRIKASALGIETQDYEKEKVEIEKLYTGYMKFNVNTDIIDILYEKKFMAINDIKEAQNKKMYPNTFVMLEDKIRVGHTSLCRYIEKEDVIKPIKQINFIWGVEPKNKEQDFAFDALLDDRISLVTLIGRAGTGKTLLALTSGLKKVIDEKLYSKLVVSRPIIPMGKDIGYLPGSKDEKLYFWMQPIFDNLRFIFSSHSISKHGNKSGENPDTDSDIQFFRDKHIIELEALTYIRGRTLPKQFLIIDEAQNLTPHEVKTIISRAGEGTKVVMTGDPYQIDNPYLDSNSNGLIYTIEKFKNQEVHAHIKLEKSERSYLASLAAELM